MAGAVWAPSLFYPSDGKPDHTFEAHAGPVRSVAFSPDSRLVASAGEDGTLRLCGRAGTEGTRQFNGHKGAAYGVAFSPDGKAIASGGRDGTVRVWDALTGAERDGRRSHDSPVIAVAFSPNGRYLASADRAGVKVWDYRHQREQTAVLLRGALERVGPLMSDSGALARSSGRIAFSQDSRSLIVVPETRPLGHKGPTVFLIDPASGEVLEAMSAADHDDVNRMILSADKRLLLAGRDSFLFHPQRTHPDWLLPCCQASTRGAVFSPDGTRSHVTVQVAWGS